MGWPRKLVLVRHAESEGNIRSSAERAEFEMGSQNYPLTERGRQQAIITGEYLRARFGKFDAMHESYYRRSGETMALMFPTPSAPDVTNSSNGAKKPFVDPRLAEAQRGIWHVMTHEQVAARFPEEIERREREGLYHYRPLGGENWPDVELRIHSYRNTLIQEYEGQRIVVCGHGNWANLFKRINQHLSIEEAMAEYKSGVVENASVTIYEGRAVDGRPRLVLTEENIVPWKGKL